MIALVASLVDCALTPSRQANILPKAVWLIICIVLPAVGPVLWFTIGRRKAVETGPTDAPDDNEEFLRGIDVDAEIDDFERRMRGDERGDS